MAYHKLCVIAKLVRDPEFKAFDNGGGVAKFGVPINFTRPKKNPQTGEWEGDSFIINVDVFNRDNYKLADIVMQSLKKGSQVYIEGRLKNNEYTDRNGVKTARPVLVADVIEFLDPRGEFGQDGGGSRMSQAAPAGSRSNGSGRSGGYQPDDMGAPASRSGGGGEDEVPLRRAGGSNRET